MPALALILGVSGTSFQLAQLSYSRHDVETRGITPGDQSHFEINGKGFYSLGTNIIPFDPFYARTTTEQVRWVLESAKHSEQNMVRVWGGGIYQPDSKEEGVYDFYGLCDELGILAWSAKAGLDFSVLQVTQRNLSCLRDRTAHPDKRQPPIQPQWQMNHDVPYNSSLLSHLPRTVLF
ncbi:glycoside hydrolase superfamily [Mycena olivaceomarginata]|nr:glycoside hydrolase superfamily [Mycena olivaceomarginata]